MALATSAVVNNAGIATRKPLVDFSAEEVRHLFAVNYFGVVAVNDAVVPHMVGFGGASDARCAMHCHIHVFSSDMLVWCALQCCGGMCYRALSSSCSCTCTDPCKCNVLHCLLFWAFALL